MPDNASQIPGFTPPVRLVFPGVRGKTKKSITIDGEVIPKGSEVIIQPLLDAKSTPPCPYKITTFKRDETQGHLPESRRNIIPVKSYDLSVKNENDLFAFTEHYQATSLPLFAGKDSPCLDDISQGEIPDCFLLAMLQSILNAPDGAEYIRSIMTQNEDGTTTVRLFNPKTLMPEHIVVPTAVLVNDEGKALSHHKALWVHLIENAYVAMETRNLESDKSGEVDASISSVFSNGGDRAMASRIMLGLNPARISTAHRAAWNIPPNEYQDIGYLKSQITGPENIYPSWDVFLDEVGASLGYEGADSRKEAERVWHNPKPKSST